MIYGRLLVDATFVMYLAFLFSSDKVNVGIMSWLRQHLQSNLCTINPCIALVTTNLSQVLSTQQSEVFAGLC